VDPVMAALSQAEAATELGELRSGRGGDRLGAPLGAPVLVVDLDRPGPGGDLRPPPGLPCVIIGISTAPVAPPAPAGPDILLSAAPDAPAPWVAARDAVAGSSVAGSSVAGSSLAGTALAGEGAAGASGAGATIVAEAEALEALIRRHPQAATTLAQVLRVGSPLGPDAALVVESLAYSTLQSGPEHLAWLATRTVRRPDEGGRPAVTMERRADALWITLDQPERRNAYSAKMRDELVAALELAAADPSIDAVHLRGNGPNFCSGGDLAEFGTRPDPATAHVIRTARSAGWWINQMADRVTVHLHGACVGAGIELAAFAARVEATADTTVALPEVSMGLIPGAGGTASIARRIGAPRTAWLALSGRRLDAATAERWRLVDHIVAAPVLY
jgi:enoyl-CoA hydratase/carnithine racemase